MVADSSFPQSGPAGEAWREFDDVVESMARLSTAEMSEGEFYAALLDRLVPALAAVGGALWTDDPQRGPRLRHQVNLEPSRLAEDPQAQRPHAQLVERVLQTGKARAVPPKSGSPGDEAANPTEFVLLLCPWRFEDESAGVVELVQRPDTSPAAQQGNLRLLAAVCELVTDFHRNRQLRGLRARAELLGRFEQYAEQVHGSLDLKATAFRIANEGRRLIGCDRVSVAVRRGAKCRVWAVSGVDRVEHRANAVRQLERLATAVAAAGMPLWHPEDAAHLPPAIERPLNAYLDESHARGLAVIPLPAGNGQRREDAAKVLGVLVVEQFQGVLDEAMRARVSAALAHAGLALKNALEMHLLPLKRPLRVLGKLVQARQLPKTVCVLLALAALAIVLVAVPADFQVKARGELQPRWRRDVFAPGDGVVYHVHVEHGQRVRAGQVLVEMRRPALDFEFRRVWGELQTARKRLASVEAERLQNPRETADQRRRHAQLTAEEEELKELIDSLKKQYEILQQQRSEAQVRSPIDADVLTWDLKSRLDARPVSRGQVLMTVADLSGPWTLELQVPDDRIAHLLAAQRKPGKAPEVSFVLATDPGVQLRGAVAEVGARTEVGEADEVFVPVTVAIDRDEVPLLVPGATVVAKIHCGRRAIGYVWLHGLIEAVQRWILF